MEGCKFGFVLIMICDLRFYPWIADEAPQRSLLTVCFIGSDVIWCGDHFITTLPYTELGRDLFYWLGEEGRGVSDHAHTHQAKHTFHHVMSRVYVFRALFSDDILYFFPLFSTVVAR